MGGLNFYLLRVFSLGNVWKNMIMWKTLQQGWKLHKVHQNINGKSRWQIQSTIPISTFHCRWYLCVHAVWGHDGQNAAPMCVYNAPEVSKNAISDGSSTMVLFKRIGLGLGYLWFVKISYIPPLIVRSITAMSMGCRWISQIPSELSGVMKMRFGGLMSNGQRVKVALVWFSMLHSSNMDRVRKTRGGRPREISLQMGCPAQQLTILWHLSRTILTIVTILWHLSKTMGTVSLTGSVFLGPAYRLVPSSFWSVNFTNILRKVGSESLMKIAFYTKLSCCI